MSKNVPGTRELGHSLPQIRGIMHLTYPDSDPHTGTVSTANAGETGAPEIEITPEMIEVGLDAFYEWIMMDDDDPRSASRRFAVTEIYRRMAARSVAKCPNSSHSR